MPLFACSQAAAAVLNQIFQVPAAASRVIPAQLRMLAAGWQQLCAPLSPPRAPSRPPSAQSAQADMLFPWWPDSASLLASRGARLLCLGSPPRCAMQSALQQQRLVGGGPGHSLCSCGSSGKHNAQNDTGKTYQVSLDGPCPAPPSVAGAWDGIR